MAGQKTDARDAHVGQRIALQRKKAALTQRRVAQSFGMSAAQLQKYEKGINRISAIHLETFSRMIGLPVEYFFEGMQRLDDVPPQGFGERAQQPYGTETAGQGSVRDSLQGFDRDSWQGLADVVARHVDAHFSESRRQDFAAAIQALNARMNGHG